MEEINVIQIFPMQVEWFNRFSFPSKRRLTRQAINKNPLIPNEEH